MVRRSYGSTLTDLAGIAHVSVIGRSWYMVERSYGSTLTALAGIAQVSVVGRSWYGKKELR